MSEEPGGSDRIPNPTKTTTDQEDQRDDAATAAASSSLEFEKVRHDIGKYLLTELCHQPRPPLNYAGDRRYLNRLWVFCNRESYESELSRALSSSSFSELVAPSISDSIVIKEKIKNALTVLAFREKCVLIQFWAPTRIEGRCLLATSAQPFGLGVLDEGLCLYRMDSLRYKFNVGEDNDEKLGVPGRVFQQKLPEWTPNVRHYSAKDYPQRDHALQCNIQGSLTLPVFEPYSQHCVGVLEIVMYPEYIDCAYEVQEVCRALKDVDLTCSKNHSFVQDCNFTTNIQREGYQHSLDEIFKGLEVVCNTHRLPLAQTWVLSECDSIVANNQSREKGCGNFDQSCMGQACMSTSNLPFYLSDARMWQFRKACTEQHLRKGEGVVGLALSTYSLCLCTNLTVLRETEYPLVHLARKYGLTSCFTICLWSVHTGCDDYVIEFFLPPTVSDIQSLVESILATLKQHFKSFKAASAMGLVFTKIISVCANGRLESIPVSQITEYRPMPKALAIGGEKSQLDSPDLQIVVEDDVITTDANVKDDAIITDANVEDDAINTNANLVCAEQCVSSIFSEKKSDSAITCAEGKMDSDVISSEREGMHKIPKRKRRKNEKSISLENLRQQFGKTIEDAAEILCVSRSTLKRICRQHGIQRWPYRKRDKDNDSFPKLKHEYGRGTERADNQTFQPADFIQPDQLNSRLAFQDVASLPAPILIPATNVINHISNDLLHKQVSVGASVVAPPISSVKHIQGLKTVNIKATCKHDIIKFQFSLSAGMVELQEQVAMRLKFKIGNFVLKYLDEDGDPILVACETDLQYLLGNLSSSDNSTIRLLVQPITV